MKNILATLLFLAAFLPQTHAAIWHVKPDGSDANNGTTWATSFKTLQKALNVAAASGDQIWMAGGVYHPTQGIGADQRFWYWDINKGVSIYGRFNGTETNINQRSLANALTILSGDVGNDDLNTIATDITDIQGDNTNYLFFVNNVTQTMRFDDLVFTGTYNPGSQTLGAVNIYGGGTHVSINACLFSGNYNGDNGALSLESSAWTNQPCSPTITFCNFEYNGSNDVGYSGGTGKSIDVRMYANGPGGKPEFSGCFIRNNTTYDQPAVTAFAVVPNCKITWMNCNFENNFCANSNLNRGGALATYAIRLECINCTFAYNSAGIHGGAVYCAYSKGNDTPQFVGCVFQHNHAGFDGGALALEGCDVNMVGGILSGNSCDRNGGAVALVAASDNIPATFRARSTNFWQNTASENGGAVYVNDTHTSLVLNYCMLSGNSAASGGALCWDITDNTNISCGLLTCIVDGNSAGEGSAFSVKRSSGTASQPFVLRSCTVYGNQNNSAIFNDHHVVDCTNTIFWGNGLPEFGGDGGTNKASWSLLESSDCASAGINGACTDNIFGKAPLFVDAAGGNFHALLCSPAVNNGNDINLDYDQNARPFPGDRADIGAFEYQGNPATIAYRDNDGDGYGIAGNTRHTCTPPPGFAAQAGDCNDNDADVNPGHPEVCDGKDNNCNNLTDYLDPGYLDTEAPIFITPPPADLSLSCADQVPPPATLTATDNCTPNPGVTFSATTTRSGNPNDCAYYTYTITRTWTAKDLRNNAATAIQVISVKDDQPPVFTQVPPNVTAGCDQSVPGYIPPSATDNCSAVSISLQTSSDRSSDPNDCAYYTYTITRTWTAVDRCGNTATAQQIVTVQDLKPPFVPLQPQAQVTVECDQAIPQITFLGSQDCDAHPILTVTEQSEEFEASPYDHVFRRIYRHIALTDHCGNATEFDQVISIRDVQPPHITNCPADLTVNGTDLGAVVDFPAAIVSENCGNYEVYYTPYEPGGSLFPVGVTQVYIDAYDQGGNYGSCEFKVTVKDDFKVHCQDPVFATIPAGTSPDNNAVRWNPPYAEDCAFCDDQLAAPQFQQRFKPLGNLNGHRYFLSNEKLPAEQAASMCTQYGGYLAAIGSNTENRMLSNELAGQNVLIGLSDAASEGAFAWADGQAAGFQNWAPGHPVADAATAAALDYVALTDAGKWQNVGADSALFILEMPCYDLRVTATNFPSNNLATVGQYEVQYQIQDACGRTDECSQPISIARDRKAYCLPNLYPDALDRDTSLWIQKVEIGTYSKTSGNNHGYLRHTAAANATLTAGETVPVRIILGATTGSGKAYVHVWFDANADRDFYDAGEVLLDTFVTTGQVYFDALIPSGSTFGDARQRMRLAVSRYYAPEACGDYVNGETEDYRMAVAAADFSDDQAADRNALNASAVLFPNPATTEAFLNLSEYEGQTCRICLLDAQGRTLQSFAVENADDALIRLDLAGLAPGFYVVQTAVDGRIVRTDKLLVSSEK